ncbi:class I poly(R)-hydroxyalkanoic acid synthase [Shewanella sp. SNU WT4]|uniref:class I poly(R)-hydroxyalkanoic acid synthase n=1 Tax=Shewanella sp. SNU WT4 TaxID=2590015 RepID=UPI001126750E|nr:class I poly(R)-hydroxyalkanoic acid synthase [Shewanella sp. SNU WT4]QDF67391.1 class I poly(R)-hydroxyalkanoic acid synthase [Shewanella sp. SNU WT4]
MFAFPFAGYLQQWQQQQTFWQQWQQSPASSESALNQALGQLGSQDWQAFATHTSQQPESMLLTQLQWFEQQLQIWQQVAFNDKAEEVIPSDPSDARFKHPDWQQEAWFSFIRQSYLLFSRMWLDTIENSTGLESGAKERLAFFSRQAINALSPSNFILSNPELLKLTLEKNGENLIAGLRTLQEDIEASADVLKIRMTNQHAFQVGRDVATTTGKVVMRNELFELLQYQATTDKVASTPMLIVPPFVNKYYIMDLTPQNSMVKWLVDQGQTVFLISWRNPGKAQAHVNMEDYVTHGVVEAINAIETITGEHQVNATGYCIGGTVLAMTQAYYRAKRMKARIKSMSFFTTLLDFSQPGEIGAYINDPVISALAVESQKKGYCDGRSLSVTFSLLRENSLYWNYYIENYLKGKSPMEFDLLYWNSDSTNVAAPTHNFMLRELYLNNKLIDPRGVKVGGVYIDLSKITIPSYFISTREDHIALWQGTYRGAKNLNGNITFVLGESGHIAGIINPPAKNKYGYWTNSDMSSDPETWLAGAERQGGSWWPHWHTWLAAQSDATECDARAIGHVEYPALMDAPGNYVRQTLPIIEEETQ